jgi:hypothetical protein
MAARGQADVADFLGHLPAATLQGESDLARLCTSVRTESTRRRHTGRGTALEAALHRSHH